MLQHLLRVGILPLTVSVLGVEVVLSKGWHEGSLHLLGQEGVPVEASEPLVLFQDLWAFFTKSVGRLTLNQSVDEVSRLD